jgi:hypothetical protein
MLKFAASYYLQMGALNTMTKGRQDLFFVLAQQAISHFAFLGEFLAVSQYVTP